MNSTISSTHSEEEEVFEYGSHNFQAERYPLGCIIPHFPWREFFADQGYTESYPALLYTDPQAEYMFETLSDVLGQLVIEPAIRLSIRLTYKEQLPLRPIGQLRLEWHAAFKWCSSVAEYPDLVPYLFLAAARHIAEEEGYGIPLQLQAMPLQRQANSEGEYAIGGYELIPLKVDA